MWVKDVFDPAWLLNPAKVFPLSVTKARRAARTGRGHSAPTPPEDT